MDPSEPRCPHCGATTNDAEGVGTTEVPSEGAVSICAYCTAVAIYTGEGLLTRRPTREELAEVMADQRVREAIAAVAALNLPRPPS